MFAIPFSRNFKYPDDNIQWNIRYKPKIKQLNDFITAYGNHRINLIFTDFDCQRDCEIVLALKEKFSNNQIVICLPVYVDVWEQKLNENNLPHYYSEPVVDWDEFLGFLNLNVTDIFVSGTLVFNCQLLSKKAKEYNKKIRCICNLCQSSWNATPSLKTFFIRPQDIKLYEKYIDTFEFYTENASLTAVNTWYEIYVKDQKWLGKLNEIIVDYNTEEDNNFIISNFGESRLNCNKKCVYYPQPTCHICDKIIELSKILEKGNITVTREKNEEKDEK